MFNRLKNALWLIVGAVVAVWAVTSLVGLVRAGPMEPPAAPGPTNRMPIFQPDPGGFPIVINQPGSYYLTQDITGETGKNGIEISASDVTLDLNGFTLMGVTGSGSGVGVPYGSHRDNISIHEGTIRGWGSAGVDLHCEACAGAQLTNLRVVSNAGQGITVGTRSMVSDSMVADNGGAGLNAPGYATVTRVTARDNGGDGIDAGPGSVVTNSISSENAGVGIRVMEGSVLEGCTADSNFTDGFQVFGRGNLIGGNTAYQNGVYGDGAGVRVFGSGSYGNRIEGDNVVANDIGIDVDDTDNIIIKNSASGNTTDYDIVAGNAVGAIIDCTGGCNSINADPWANFRY
jgi:parallel beta-helix repeat protein